MASYEETLNMIRRKKKNNTSSNISDTRARVYNSLGMSMPKKEQNANQ